MQYTTKSQQQTINLGKKIAADLKAGDIVLLEGELGAGKTTLVKGIAKYFGVQKNVISPTFTLMNIYDIKTLKHPDSALAESRILDFAPKQNRDKNIKTLIHIDTYRLEDEKDLIEIGVEDYLGAPETVCLIEWPEKIKRLLRGRHVKKIRIEHKGKNKRKITITQKSKLKSQNYNSKRLNQTKV